jgi:hypothetical protein
MDEKKGEILAKRKIQEATPTKNINTLAHDFNLFKELSQTSQQGTFETRVTYPFILEPISFLFKNSEVSFSGSKTLSTWLILVEKDSNSRGVELIDVYEKQLPQTIILLYVFRKLY